MAIVIVRGAAAFGERTRPTVIRAFLAVAVVGLGFGHLVAAPALRVVMASVLSTLARDSQTLAAAAPPCRGIMVMVAASDPSLSTYLAPTLIVQGRAPASFRVLSMAAADHRIENVTGSGFDLAILAAVPRQTIWERLYRHTGLDPGYRVATPGLEVAVVEARGGAPTRLRVDFGQPLDSPDLCFVAWRGGALARLPPLAPSAAIDIPHEPGPMGW